MLFNFPLCISVHLTAGSHCPNLALTAPVSKEGWRGLQRRKNRKKEQVGTFFSGPDFFFIWSARSCWTTNQKCAKEESRQQNTDRSLAFLSPQKSHPQAKPATFLGPLWLSLSLSGLCYGIFRRESDGKVSCVHLALLYRSQLRAPQANLTIWVEASTYRGGLQLNLKNLCSHCYHRGFSQEFGTHKSRVKAHLALITLGTNPAKANIN